MSATWTFTFAGDGLRETSITFEFRGRRYFGRWHVRHVGRFRTYEAATDAVRAAADRRMAGEFAAQTASARQPYPNE